MTLTVEKNNLKMSIHFFPIFKSSLQRRYFLFCQIFHSRQLVNWMFFQNLHQMLVLVKINIDGVEKIEVIPSNPWNLITRKIEKLIMMYFQHNLNRHQIIFSNLVVLYDIWKVHDQFQNISRLSQPIVITREEESVCCH